MHSKVSWWNIFIFYAIAFAVSGPFNSGFLIPHYQKLTDGLLIKNWPFLPAAAGTLIAALIAFKFDKNLNRRVTLTGNSNLKNISISLVPILIFTSIGLYNTNNVNTHYYALVFSSAALVYAISEEIFWRSYLLDALRPLKKTISSLVIGMFWWAWHFRFYNNWDFTWFFLIIIISSFLLYQFADETKSYLTAAGLHSLIIITTSEGEMTQSKTVGLFISVALWLVIGKFWKTHNVIPKHQTLIDKDADPTGRRGAI